MTATVGEAKIQDGNLAKTAVPVGDRVRLFVVLLISLWRFVFKLLILQF